MPLDTAPADALARFVLGTRAGDVPEAVRARTVELMLDLVGVAAAARAMPAARIGRDVAVRLWGAGRPGDAAPLLLDGRVASKAGAAYAGATQIDALDAHDGHVLTKGHAGCALLPALLAMAPPDAPGAEAVTAMALGYEIGTRAGIALHATAADYHTSGAWIALAVAALGVRLAGGDAATLRHALGIAEYHGPRSPMMREIDNPTMLHDGSGWGAMAGVTAAELALAGFTGAPALTVEGGDVAALWADLGEVWRTPEQYVKLFPVCRWAQPAVEGARMLREAHRIAPDAVRGIRIHTFHVAARLAAGVPESPAMAQYSLAWPVAAMLARGACGPAEVSGPAFADAAIRRLVALVTVEEDATLTARFPAERIARVEIGMADSRRLRSPPCRAPGDAEAPIPRAGIIAKFRDYATPVLGGARTARIEGCVLGLNEAPSLEALRAALHPAP